MFISRLLEVLLGLVVGITGVIPPIIGPVSNESLSLITETYPEF